MVGGNARYAPAQNEANEFRAKPPRGGTCARPTNQTKPPRSPTYGFTPPVPCTRPPVSLGRSSVPSELRGRSSYCWFSACLADILSPIDGANLETNVLIFDVAPTFFARVGVTAASRIASATS